MKHMKKTTMTMKFTGAAALVCGLLGAGTSAFAANAKVCFEAESASSVSSPVKKVTPGSNGAYSGSGYIDIPWDKNKTKGIGSATYRINVKTGGTYYLWARTYWANGCGNSIGMSVNGGGSITLGEDGTYDRWHWVGGSRVTLKAGTNTFTLKNRETGVRVDQIFLCQDGDYEPAGKRKATN